MTKRILTTTAAALALGMTTMAGAQSVTTPDDEMSVTGQAADAGREIVDTGQAAAGAVGDAAQGAYEATTEAAEDGYGAASNTAARLDAALTEDAVIMSSDGEVIGTVYRTDMDGERVLIDVDGELENTIARRGVENASVRLSSIMATPDGLMLDMTNEQFARALETGPLSPAGN